MVYENKVKRRAIEYREKGNRIGRTAETFGISTKTLDTWLKEYRDNGVFSVKPSLPIIPN